MTHEEWLKRIKNPNLSSGELKELLKWAVKNAEDSLKKYEKYLTQEVKYE